MENQEKSMKKILLVDDDDFLREIYENKFKEEGFEVVTAKDGQEALEKIEAGLIPDIVFTGIRMPRLTGFDLAKKLTEKPDLAKIPVAIFSHLNRREDQETAKALGIDEFFAQGIIPINEIVRRIRDIIGVHKVFRVSISRKNPQAESLLTLLSNQQDILLSPDIKEYVIELEPQKDRGRFIVKLLPDES